MKQRKGFTLIEVLIVLVIAALLAGVAYPNYARSLLRMRRVEGQAALVGAMQKQEMYRAQHNTYLAFDADAPPPEDLGLHWWSGQDAAASAYELEGRACEGGTIADCVELRARPGTERVNVRFSDAECGTLSLDSRGRQGASGAPGKCWL